VPKLVTIHAFLVDEINQMFYGNGHRKPNEKLQVLENRHGGKKLGQVQSGAPRGFLEQEADLTAGSSRISHRASMFRKDSLGTRGQHGLAG
jgi:hypothetical protein